MCTDSSNKRYKVILWLSKRVIHGPCILGKGQDLKKHVYLSHLPNYFSTPLMMNTTPFLRNLLKKNYLRLWRRLFSIRFWEFGDEQQFSLAPKTTKNLPWYVPVWKLHVFFPFDKTTAIWILIKKKSYYIQHEGVIIAKDLKFSNENWIKLSWHNTQTLQKLFIT